MLYERGRLKQLGRTEQTSAQRFASLSCRVDIRSLDHQIIRSEGALLQSTHQIRGSTLLQHGHQIRGSSLLQSRHQIIRSEGALDQKEHSPAEQTLDQKEHSPVEQTLDQREHSPAELTLDKREHQVRGSIRKNTLIPWLEYHWQERDIF